MDFGRRMVDGFFRRWPFYIVPVVLFGVLGVIAAGGGSDTYMSSSTLNASRNPMLDQVEIRGADIAQWETPAAGTARLINEQLGTNAFVDDVAERAGLTELIESGAITRDDVRLALGAADSGQSVLRVFANWDDPGVAQALVVATIDAYRKQLADVIASDSVDAIEFWSAQAEEAQAELDEAQTDLATYTSGLPSEVLVPRTPDQELTSLRLTRAVDAAVTKLDDARTAIDQAELSIAQADSASHRLFRVVDAAELPLAPVGDRLRSMMALAAYLLMGVLVSVVALVVVTAVDRTVRSPAQLAVVADGSATAVIQRIRRLAPPSFRGDGVM